MKRFQTLAGCLLPPVIPPSCMGRPVLQVSPDGALPAHDAIDYDYREDREKLHASMGHLLVFNPGDAVADRSSQPVISQGASRRTHDVTIPPHRLAAIYMDDLAAHNEHYATEFNSDEPVAVQWRREVYWTDSDEIMAFWSVPAVPLSEPSAAVASKR